MQLCIRSKVPGGPSSGQEVPIKLGCKHRKKVVYYIKLKQPQPCAHCLPPQNTSFESHWPKDSIGAWQSFNYTWLTFQWVKSEKTTVSDSTHTALRRTYLQFRRARTGIFCVFCKFSLSYILIYAKYAAVMPNKKVVFLPWANETHFLIWGDFRFFQNCRIRASNTSFLIHFRCWIRIWGYYFENRYQLINIDQSIFHHHIRKLTHKMSHLVRFQKVQSFILNQLVLMRLAQLRPIAATLDTRLNVFWSFLCSYLLPMRFSTFSKMGPYKRTASSLATPTRGMGCPFFGRQIHGPKFCSK